jgi:hypothetical protein
MTPRGPIWATQHLMVAPAAVSGPNRATPVQGAWGTYLLASAALPALVSRDLSSDLDANKHLYAAQLIKRGLYDDLQSFAQLEKRISALGEENIKIVGSSFGGDAPSLVARQQLRR